MSAIPTIDELNALGEEAFAHALAPLFEGAPRFLRRLAARRPFASEDDLFAAARGVARSMPEEEQIELLDAHPPIGADPASISALSHREQGYDEDAPSRGDWVADELRALNEAYERRFGFRFVVFVAGRPRADIIPILEHAARADREEELRRGLDDVILIAADRLAKLRGPRPLREEQREAVALEVSRWMVGELDRGGLIRAAHRLVEDDVRSPCLLEVSLADDTGVDRLEESVGRLMAELGLEGWTAEQAGQLLALHAAASILGRVSQPIDGARRIAAVSGNARFDELVRRWEATPEDRASIDEEITAAAAELFGPPDDGGDR